ncbi:hypothetical protein ACWGOK_41965 [Streptomyces eurythermus]
MPEPEAGSWWAAFAVTITTAGAVATAWIGSRVRQQRVEVPTDSEGEVEDSDLSTIAGLAAALTETMARLAAVEARERDTRERVAALWRYIRLLRATIRGLGGEVPEPDRTDRRHLIEQ